VTAAGLAEDLAGAHLRMVLLAPSTGEPLPSDARGRSLLAALLADDALRAGSAAFMAQPLTRVRRERAAGDPLVMCATQGELACAMVTAGAPELAIGTDDFTTCCVIVLRNPSSGAMSLAHFGNSNELVAATPLLCALVTPGVFGGDAGLLTLEAHVVGSYDDGDDAGVSVKNAQTALECLHRLLLPRVLLKTLVVLGDNTLRGVPPRPRVQGLVAHACSGAVLPATFDDDARGPDLAARFAGAMFAPQAPPALPLRSAAREWAAAAAAALAAAASGAAGALPAVAAVAAVCSFSSPMPPLSLPLPPDLAARRSPDGGGARCCCCAYAPAPPPVRVPVDYCRELLALREPDEFLRRTSTSPAVERPRFVPDMRAALALAVTANDAVR
jgi:hypothetical protein